MIPKICLVEDDQTIGYMLSEYLKLKSFDVTWFREPVSAGKSIPQSPPDLCIFDVSLPEMDGFELARKVKAQLPSLPVIFLTARSL